MIKLLALLFVAFTAHAQPPAAADFEALLAASPNDALVDALWNNDALLVRRALEAGADANHIVDLSGSKKPVAVLAGFHGNVALLQELVRYGADLNRLDNVNENIIPKMAAYCRREENYLGSGFPYLTLDQRLAVVRYLIEQHVSVTPISTRDAECLVSNHEDGWHYVITKRQGYDALYLAVLVGRKPMVELLARAPGAPINEVIAGKTPLMAALLGENAPGPEIAEILIVAGADLEASASNVTVLAEAAAEGKLETVRFLLKKGAKVDGLAAHPETSPLALAAAQGHLDVAQLLVDSGANLTATGTAALHAALLAGHLDVAKLLGDHGAKSDAATLAELIGAKSLPVPTRLEAFEFALRHGADPNGIGSYSTPVLMSAIQANEPALVRLLLKYGANPNMGDRYNKPLAACVYNELWDVAVALVEAGANTDDGGPGTFLQQLLAARHVHLELLRAVLRVTKGIDARDSLGETALLKAAHRGWKAGVAELLAAHANVSLADNKGRTPLFYSTGVDVAEALLGAGAALETVDTEHGDTPLLWFVDRENLPLVKLLARKGANLAAVNKQGLGAVGIAKVRANVPILLFLCQAGSTDPYCKP